MLHELPGRNAPFGATWMFLSMRKRLRCAFFRLVDEECALFLGGRTVVPVSPVGRDEHLRDLRGAEVLDRPQCLLDRRDLRGEVVDADVSAGELDAGPRRA